MVAQRQGQRKRRPRERWPEYSELDFGSGLVTALVPRAHKPNRVPQRGAMHAARRRLQREEYNDELDRGAFSVTEDERARLPFVNATIGGDWVVGSRIASRPIDQ